MNDLSCLLLNRRKLRASAKLMDLDELLLISKTIAALLEDKKVDTAAAERMFGQKHADCQEIIELMRVAGVSVNEIAYYSMHNTLVGLDAAAMAIPVRFKRSPKIKINKRPPKYSYVLNGAEKTWSGAGRMPLHIKHQIESGAATLESFLIKSS